MKQGNWPHPCEANRDEKTDLGAFLCLFFDANAILKSENKRNG